MSNDLITVNDRWIEEFEDLEPEERAQAFEALLLALLEITGRSLMGGDVARAYDAYIAGPGR